MNETKSWGIDNHRVKIFLLSTNTLFSLACLALFCWAAWSMGYCPGMFAVVCKPSFVGTLVHFIMLLPILAPLLSLIWLPFFLAIRTKNLKEKRAAIVINIIMLVGLPIVLGILLSQ